MPAPTLFGSDTATPGGEGLTARVPPAPAMPAATAADGDGRRGRISPPGLAIPPALAGWPGAKGGGGVAERIISLFPPHTTYVEACVGGGAVFRRKPPAMRSVLIDNDPKVVEAWRRAAPPGTTVVAGDASSWLSTAPAVRDPDALVYADPPYVHSTRTKKRLYRHEWSDAQHEAFIAVLDALPCSVFLSGYRCPLYDRLLATWERVDFPAMTRGGMRTESVWCRQVLSSFSAGVAIAGFDYRERERIKKKAARWAAKLAAMPQGERAAVWAALQRAAANLQTSHRSDAGCGGSTVGSGSGLIPGVAVGSRSRSIGPGKTGGASR